MPRARLKAGRQAQEIGAAIIETWLQLLPAPATIESVAAAADLTITVDRQIFQTGQTVSLRKPNGTTSTGLKVINPQAAANYKQILPIYQNNGTTPEPSDPAYVGGLVIPEPAILNQQIKDALKIALNQIVAAGKTVEPVFDEQNKIYVAVPTIPPGILTRSDLFKYLEEYHRYGQGRHYHDELGVAVLYGCR